MAQVHLEQTKYITLQMTMDEAKAVRFWMGQAVDMYMPTLKLAEAGDEVFDALDQALPNFLLPYAIHSITDLTGFNTFDKDDPPHSHGDYQ